MVEYQEVIIKGETFRIKKQRDWKGFCLIERKKRDKTLDFNDVIMSDCQLFNKPTKTWNDLKETDITDIETGIELFGEVTKVREAEKDFQKVQKKKPTVKSGS